MYQYFSEIKLTLYTSHNNHFIKSLPILFNPFVDGLLINTLFNSFIRDSINLWQSAAEKPFPTLGLIGAFNTGSLLTGSIGFIATLGLLSSES